MRPVAAATRFLRDLLTRRDDAPTRPVGPAEAAKTAAWHEQWRDRTDRLDELRDERESAEDGGSHATADETVGRRRTDAGR